MDRHQSDRWFVNLALLGGTIILLAVLLFDNSKTSQGANTLSNLLPDEITRIQILRSGKQTIELSRQSAYWEMESPLQGRVDNAVLQRILSIAGLEIVSQIDPDSVQLEDFDLQSPKISLIINDTVIGFGDLQPVDKLRYLLIKNTIYLVADQHMSQLNTGSVSYIDRHLIPEGDIIREILVDGNSIELTDDTRARWQLIKANWVSHIDDAGGETGVKVQIRLQNQDALPIEYRAVKRETALVLIRGGLEYHLGHNAIDTLGLPLAGS